MKLAEMQEIQSLEQESARITRALEQATRMIRTLRQRLDVAMEALEFYAVGDDFSRNMAIETLERIDAIVVTEVDQ